MPQKARYLVEELVASSLEHVAIGIEIKVMKGRKEMVESTLSASSYRKRPALQSFPVESRDKLSSCCIHRAPQSGPRGVDIRVEHFDTEDQGGIEVAIRS
jgi:hypothetical protein